MFKNRLFYKVFSIIKQHKNSLGGETALPRFEGLGIAVVQTKPKAPEPIRTPKLSGFRHS